MTFIFIGWGNGNTRRKPPTCGKQKMIWTFCFCVLSMSLCFNVSYMYNNCFYYWLCHCYTDDLILYFIAIEGMYPVIKQSHTAVGHGWLYETHKVLMKHCTVISREVMKVFLKMCEQCAMKKNRSEMSKLVIKPVASSGFHSRGQFDLIDHQSVPDNEY